MGVNSLGIGSGVLTADLLDQLREADDNTILKPLENKLELATQKEEARDLLNGFMTTFKSSTASLGGELLYLDRAVSGNDDFVTVSAQSGADLQSFNITDIVKAEKDVWNSTNTFTDTTSAIAGLGTGTLRVTIDGTSLDVDYTSATTLTDIQTAINDGLGEKVTVSNLQIGDSAFSLSITADDFNKAITFTELQKQENTVSLTGTFTAGDTFNWSDGTNSISLDDTTLTAGNDATATGVEIAAAINADSTLSALYTATAINGGFTITSNTASTAFTGTTTSTGVQTSLETITNSSDESLFTPVAQIDTVTLAGTFTAGDTFTWSDGTNSIALDDSILTAGGDAATTGLGIVAAIQGDATLNALYNVIATADGFTIESKTAGQPFTGTSTSTGVQTSSDATTTDAEGTLSNLLSLNNIQVASEASFKFNGIAITRSSNTINDLVNGVTITLNAEQTASDTSSIVIGQNDTAIKSEVELFVTNYNLLASNLSDMTLYNSDKGVAGIFNGENFLKSITSQLKNIFTQTDSSGNSLFNYGLDIDRDGVMSVDSSVLSSKLSADPSALELLFRGQSEQFNDDGTTKSDAVVGIFQQLDVKMSSYTGSNKLLANFTTLLSDERENLIEQFDKQKASLDSRYKTLTKKFAAYDSVINKLNNQFSSLKLLIDAESNSDS